MLTHPTSEYTMVMHDSYLIDGQPSGGTKSEEGASWLLCGAFANHPCCGEQPNAMFYPIACDADDLPAASVDALRQISWRDTTPLTSEGHMLRVVAVVALRDLQDEELFVDYRYDVASDSLPPWYHHVEREGAAHLGEPPRPGFDWFIHA